MLTIIKISLLYEWQNTTPTVLRIQISNMNDDINCKALTVSKPACVPRRRYKIILSLRYNIINSHV